MRAPFASHMVSRKNRLNELREQAATLEGRTGRKISRNKSTKGVEIAGTKFDPRRDPSKVSRYNTRQLESYVKSLQTFNGRSTQFEAGVRGAPLPRFGKYGWQNYKAGENAVRAQAAKVMEPVQDVRLPGPGSTPKNIREGDETISQRAAKIRGKHPTVTNQGYLPPERQPKNIKDADSLAKLTKANAKRMTKTFQAKEHKRAREELKQMVAVFQDDDLTNNIASLTKGQFDMLWNFTKFADALSLTYHHIQSKGKRKQDLPQEMIDNQVNQAKTLVEWVKKFKI